MSGQGLADYAIALAIIAIVVVFALIPLSGPGTVKIRPPAPRSDRGRASRWEATSRGS